MPRIRTDQPSSGRPKIIYIPASQNFGFVGTEWSTLIEAPDFSIPTTDDEGVTFDPSESDNGRELRPGEIFFETPLSAINGTSQSHWVELRMIFQGLSGDIVPITSQITVPAGETVYIPIQGLRLLKEQFPDPSLAGSFVSGQEYQITFPGDTDFVSLGAADNFVGTTFTASGAGSGSGRAVLVSSGGRLQIRAGSGTAIKVIGSAVELEASTHSPDTETA